MGVRANAGGRCNRGRVATLLFLDDFYLNRWENLRRRSGSRSCGAGHLQRPGVLVGLRPPTVYRGETGGWRCLCQGKPRTEAQEPRYPLLREGEDGVRRQGPDLTRAVPLVRAPVPQPSDAGDPAP